jgi:hypothetical protein
MTSAAFNIQICGLPMADNQFNLVAFDPGGTIGWAHFIVDFRAFSRPEAKVLRWVQSWDCGEFTGQEGDQLQAALALVDRARYTGQLINHTEVLSEDFELTQLIGGDNLLSPVRINAVLDWEIRKRYGLTLIRQRRQMRKGITRERLKLFGFKGRFRKDEFAAMQHAVTRLRLIKAESRRRPWKLEDNISTNAAWDCACEEGKPCNLRHPK